MSDPLLPDLEVWRGGVPLWECDAMGHMNVRFYLSRFSEGLVGLAVALGLPRAMTAGAAATLRPEVQHIRFLREARAGAALHMTAALTEFSESSATALLVLIHTPTGEPAAACRITLSHATPAGRVFPWPQLTRERAAALMVETPPYAAARSLAARDWPTEGALQTALRIGMRKTAAGAVVPAECDAFGRLSPTGFIGRLAQSVSHDNAPLKAALQAHPPEGLSDPTSLGGAMVEYRIAYSAWPIAGEGIEVFSGVSALSSSTRRAAYWMIDPASGQAFATAEAAYLSFDLQARKALKLPASAVRALQSVVIAELAG